MFNKILTSLLFVLVVGLSGAPASGVIDNEPVNGKVIAQDHMVPSINLTASRTRMQMADCCKTKSGQASCQHCTDNGCDNGACASCSHCITALLPMLSHAADSGPSFTVLSLNHFQTIYQATDPRPPRA